MGTDKSRVGRFAWWAAIVAPPVLGGASLATVVKKHPFASLIIVAGYEAFLAVSYLSSKVYGRLQERWIDRMTETIDAAIQRTLSRYRKSYCDYILAVHRDIDLKGLATQSSYALALNEVFVDLSLDSRALHSIPVDLLSSEEPNVTHEREAYFDPQRRISIWEALSDDDLGPARLAIVGAPGTGKTTLLKYVAMALCGQPGKAPQNDALKGKLPILIFLREHVRAITADSEIDLANIVRKAVKSIPAKEPPAWIDVQLKKGRCVVMLDGLDEVAVAEDRAKVSEWVESQIAHYPRNRFIVTSRPYGYQTRPINSATTLHVRRFTEVQIRKFLQQWFLATYIRRTGRDDIGVRTNSQRDADDLLRRIVTSSALYDLAVNPLLLTMIAHVHFYRGTLPGRRVELYREICSTFLGKRQEAKGVRDDLAADQKELVLRELAHEMMLRKSRDIDKKEAYRIIGKPLKSVGGQLTPADFMLLVERGSGLILEREMDIFSFAHLTFQEYLCAAHMAEYDQPAALVANVDDEWWRETILLYAAQADGSRIVSKCLKVAGQSPYLTLLAVDCAEQSRKLAPELREAVSKAIYEDTRNAEITYRRAIASIVLGKKLRQVKRLDATSYICEYPITNKEYCFFVDEMRDLGEGHEPDHWSTSRPPHWESGDTWVTGLRGEDVIAFVDWVSQIFSEHGWVYDIATMENVPGEELITSVLDQDVRGIWIRMSQGPRCFEGEVHQARYFPYSRKQFPALADSAMALLVEDVRSATARFDRGVVPADEVWREILDALSETSLADLRTIARSGSGEKASELDMSALSNAMGLVENSVDLAHVLKQIQMCRETALSLLTVHGHTDFREIASLCEYISTMSAIAFSRHRVMAERGVDLNEIRMLCRVASLVVLLRISAHRETVLEQPRVAKYSKEWIRLGIAQIFRRRDRRPDVSSYMVKPSPAAIVELQSNIICKLLVLEHRISGDLAGSEYLHLIRT